MTLQQLQYIIAVDKYRHFVKAAEACGVTQSTLSTMIRNLENELDATIFDRTAHPVRPTYIGEKIIAQAKIVLFNTGQLEEITKNERSTVSGSVQMGIIPTVSPYILPKMFRYIGTYHELHLSVIEARTSAIIEKLKKAELDMAIMATPLGEHDLLEIPLYYEKFYAYISPAGPLYQQEKVTPKQLPGKDLWLLQEGHCFRNQIINLCNSNASHSAVYEAGNIDTLVRVVDENGGHTIIPELHIQFLSEMQKGNIREITPSLSVREISLVIRNDFVKERILNIISDIVKNIIPDNMIDTRLKKYAVKI